MKRITRCHVPGMYTSEMAFFIFHVLAISVPLSYVLGTEF